MFVGHRIHLLLGRRYEVQIDWEYGARGGDRHENAIRVGYAAYQLRCVLRKREDTTAPSDGHRQQTAGCLGMPSRAPQSDGKTDTKGTAFEQIYKLRHCHRREAGGMHA